MPDRSKTSSAGELRLIRGLDALTNPLRQNQERRLQLLERVDPVVANWVKAVRQRETRVSHPRFKRRLEKLVEFMQRNDRLPRPRVDGEHDLYGWLCIKRNQLGHLPAELRSQLIDSHPAVAAFMRSSEV